MGNNDLDHFLASQQKRILTAKEPVYFRIKVSPGSSRNEFVALLNTEEPTLKIRIAAPPEKGKANKEIIKFFKKQFGRPCEIVSGMTDEVKLVRVIMSKSMKI